MPRSKSRKEKRKNAVSSGMDELSFAALSGLAQQALASILEAGPEEAALDRAQELVFDAWEADSAAKRTALARKALKISPLCADAYVLLAEHATPLSEEEIGFYQRGVEAGERALGKETFACDVGHFWALIETRPYMRARFGLAEALWQRGRRDEALDHFRDMLRLNPNDNQGVRYTLAADLVDMESDKELSALLKKYRKDGSAWWAYSRVLLSFRTAGLPAARRQLAAALSVNAHVPCYLLGDKKMPKMLPEFYSPGDENEAVCYVHQCGRGWMKSAGAIDWLRQQRQDAAR